MSGTGLAELDSLSHWNAFLSGNVGCADKLSSSRGSVAEWCLWQFLLYLGQSLG